MKRAHLASLAVTLIITVACCAFGSQQHMVFAQANNQANACRNVYELMRANAQSNPQFAAQMGQRFLDGGCGNVYPTLAAPVQQYVAWFDQQQVARPTTAGPQGMTRNNQATAAQRANAQTPGEFKEGDRVEVDILMISTSSPAGNQVWKKGTVTEVDLRPGYRPAYVVQVDPLPGQLPQVYRIPIKPNATERVWIRSGGGAAPTIETNKLHVDANDTVLADREVLDCGHFTQPAARNGSPLPAELSQKLIRCALGEHPSLAGGQGATTVNISEFSIGAPRRWNLRIDTGAGGTVDTIVYPVRVTYTTKSFYREQNIVIADREQLFACHVDVGKWICGPDQVLKEGEKRQIQVKK